jgi:HTH-type transcriptional regulator / antitoxin HipB
VSARGYCAAVRGAVRRRGYPAEGGEPLVYAGAKPAFRCWCREALPEDRPDLGFHRAPVPRPRRGVVRASAHRVASRRCRDVAVRRHSHLSAYGDMIRLSTYGDILRDQVAAMRINTFNDLIAVARGRRMELGLTQAQLAIRAGVSRDWIISFERGKPTVELARVLRLLSYLGLQIDVTPVTDETTSKAAPVVDLDAVLERYGRS